MTIMKIMITKLVLIENTSYINPRSGGWYPELVFLSVVFSNSTNLTEVILNSNVFKI